MFRKNDRRSTAVFAATLIVTSAICLTYNIILANDETAVATFSDLISHKEEVSDSGVVSSVAAANIINQSTVSVSVPPSYVSDTAELLPPIILPPNQ